MPDTHIQSGNKGAKEIEDDGEPFKEKMKRLAATLRGQIVEAKKLDAAIAANLSEGAWLWRVRNAAACPHPPRDHREKFSYTKDAGLNLQVRLDGQTVWLTQADMAELFQTTPQNITLHIKSIYEDREQTPEATCKDYLQVRPEGTRRVQRALKHYNLDMILAVGYRVRSQRGTQFRQWATARLSELLVKGFTLDDERIDLTDLLYQVDC
jgi:hypothetical protein